MGSRRVTAGGGPTGLTCRANMTGTTMRHAGLRQMLSERRRELQDEVQSRMRDGAPTDRLRCVTTSNIPTPTSKATSSSFCSTRLLALLGRGRFLRATVLSTHNPNRRTSCRLATSTVTRYVRVAGIRNAK